MSNKATSAEDPVPTLTDAALVAIVSGGLDYRTTAGAIAELLLANPALATFVQSYLDDLIGGAPSALDTLNELAAAINDDASYAATVTTALGVINTAIAALNSGKANVSHTHVAADTTDLAEATQDIVGAMFIAAGGTYDDGAGTVEFPPQPASRYHVGASWSGEGVAMETPADVVTALCHTAGNITKCTVLTVGGPGTCQIDIWSDTYGNYPPTDADSITGSTPPTVTAGIKSVDATFTGWNTSVAEGQILSFNLDGSSVFTMVSVFLEITPTI